MELGDKIREGIAQVEAGVRKDPVTAAWVAICGGFVLSRLPLLSITAGIIRLGLWLVRPALLVLGIVKIADFVKGRDG